MYCEEKTISRQACEPLAISSSMHPQAPTFAAAISGVVPVSGSASSAAPLTVLSSSMAFNRDSCPACMPTGECKIQLYNHKPYRRKLLPMATRPSLRPLQCASLGQQCQRQTFLRIGGHQQQRDLLRIAAQTPDLTDHAALARPRGAALPWKAQGWHVHVVQGERACPPCRILPQAVAGC